VISPGSRRRRRGEQRQGGFSATAPTRAFTMAATAVHMTQGYDKPNFRRTVPRQLDAPPDAGRVHGRQAPDPCELVATAVVLRGRDIPPPTAPPMRPARSLPATCAPQDREQARGDTPPISGIATTSPGEQASPGTPARRSSPHDRDRPPRTAPPR